MVFPTRSTLFLSLGLLGFSLVSLLAQPAHGSGPGDQQRTQGAALFADKGCAHCHGPSGFGGSDTGPDLSQVRKELKPEEIAQQIHDGGNNMPPFGDALSQDEISSLVAYLHAKRTPPPGWSKIKPTQPAAKPAATSDPD